MKQLSLFFSFLFFCCYLPLTSIQCGDTLPDKVIDEKDIASIKLYKRYRFLSNKVLTFIKRDEITEKEAATKRRFYRVGYKADRKIVKVEIFLKKEMHKRWRFDLIGNVIRVEIFRNKKVIEYHLNHYDPDERTTLVRKEIYNPDGKKLRQQNYLYGEMEEIDYFNAKGIKSKTELYAGGEVDLVKYFDNRGNIIKETGTYNNNQYPYSMTYIFNEENKLAKSEYRQKNQLKSIYYYNKKGVNYKEDQFDVFGKKNKTIYFDDQGNPIKKKKRVY